MYTRTLYVEIGSEAEKYLEELLSIAIVKYNSCYYCDDVTTASGETVHCYRISEDVYNYIRSMLNKAS